MNTAYAHILVLSKDIDHISKAVLIDDPLVSHAVYGEIKEKRQVDYIKFNIKKGETLHIELSVPLIKGNMEFKPSVAVIGKGLPCNSNNTAFIVPEGYGFFILNSENKYKKAFEPFTQTSYLEKKRIQMLMPVTGECYLAVFSPEYDFGKYLVAIGDKEKLSIKDIAVFPILWYKVKYWFSPVRAVSIFLLLLTILMGIIYLIKGRNKK
jgi:hypothetical protein